MRIKNEILVKIYRKIGIYWPLKEYYLGYFGYRVRFIGKIFIDKIFAYNIMPKDSYVVRCCLYLMGGYLYGEEFLSIT
jgi:hypothetical protein